MKSLLSFYFKWWHFKWSVPNYDIKIEHKKENEEKYLSLLSDDGVRIVRSSPHGIPHIFGSTKYDCYFGQGFAQAQERLGQLETIRRISFGRMAELDKKFLFLDKMMRTIGIQDKKLLDEYLKGISPEELKTCQSYVNGINYFIKSKQYQKPVHLYETGNPDVEEFEITDIIVITLFVAWEMNMGGWLIKIVNATLQTIVSKEDLKAFQVGVEKEHQPVPNFYTKMDFEEVEKFLKLNTKGGSNCVAISGKFTKSGSACLGADTHLAVLNPSFWFQNRIVCLKGEQFDATGFTPTGFYGLTLGHNNFIGYGITLSFCDIYELYFEELHPEDKNKYVEYIDEEGKKIYKDFGIRNEIFVVNGHHNVNMNIRNSDRGSIISDIWDNVHLREFEKQVQKKSWFSSSKEKNTRIEDTSNMIHSMENNQNYVIAFKSIFTEYKRSENDNSNIFSMFEAHLARNFEEFKGYLYNARVLTLNMIYGDKEGNIGYFLTGSIPKRTKEAQEFNNIPLPGWDQKNYGWKGFHDIKKNPQCFNPKCGYIVSCNQEMISQSDYYGEENTIFFGRVFLPSTRAREMTSLVLKKFSEIKQYSKKDEEIEGEGEIIEENKKDPRVDTNFMKFLQSSWHMYEDNEFAKDLVKSFLSRKKEILENKMNVWFEKSTFFKKNRKIMKKEIHENMIFDISNQIVNWDNMCDIKSTGCTFYTVFEIELLRSICIDGNEFMKRHKKFYTLSLIGNGIDREFWPFNEYWEKSQDVIELLLSEENLKNPKTLAYNASKIDFDEKKETRKEEEEDEEIEGENEKEKKVVVDIDFLVFKVLIRVVKRLRKMYPKLKLPQEKYLEELKSYQWGKLHTITWKHNLNEFTDELDIGPFEIGGNSKTPNAFSNCMDLKDLKAIDHPALRFVVDMKNAKKSASGICPPGLCENPCSKHYSDTAVPYIRQIYFPMTLPNLNDFVGKDKKKDHEGLTVIRKLFNKKKKIRKKKKKVEKDRKI